MQRSRLVMSTRIWMVVVVLVALGLTGRAAVGRAMRCLEYARFLEKPEQLLSGPSNQQVWGTALLRQQEQATNQSSVPEPEALPTSQDYRRAAWRFWELTPRDPGFLRMLEEWQARNEANVKMGKQNGRSRANIK